MAKLSLDPNETIVFQADSVTDLKKLTSGEIDEIILTDLNFYYISKGIFRNIAEIRKHPINTIKLIDGKPNIQISFNSSKLCKQISLYFVDGDEKFALSMFTGKKAEDFKNCVYKVVTGDICRETSNENSAVSTIGGLFKSAISTAKNAVGLSDGQDSPLANKQKEVTKKCMFCSAPISGLAGSKVRCKYCDSEQTL